MTKRQIGNADLYASPLILGIMRMADKSTKEAAVALETAFDHGIYHIDSADIYGKGEADSRFGQALKASSLNRDDLIIQNKAGIVIKEAGGPRYDFSKAHLISAVDQSLEKMGIDYLDNFLLHRPDPLMQVEEVAEAFYYLKHSGKVRHFGVSNFNPSQIEFLQSALLDKLQTNQLQFGLMHADMISQGVNTNMSYDEGASENGNAGLIEYCRFKQITIQAWSPFQFGMIQGSFIDHPDFPELNAKLAELADRHQVGKNAIAAAWILKHPANMQVIIGTMTPDHIKDSAQAAHIKLSNQEWYDLYLAAGHPLP
ncbi:aldo/keto reductase [Aerococcus kribbianus]|uniref:Aldo/keto reductase n=1 Tax=Aerococcus kribbianus TaxID=2999064 RepID=A0A9X3FN21_9LACT|nr:MULTISPECIES: aldo/keto reductase [unclassified Aerococcus]MCZ0716783.1 aldo/keto reductase [Aerococcus sp. YH-aer221]MCZ0725071.1 aldo/keto reductase [Aerococcus sp. YH-aer222]